MLIRDYGMKEPCICAACDRKLPRILPPAIIKRKNSHGDVPGVQLNEDDSEKRPADFSCGVPGVSEEELGKLEERKNATGYYRY